MIEESKIKQYKLVFAKDLNSNSTLFGGEALKWMDEAAYIAAVKHTKKKLATASVSRLKFFKPIPKDSIAEILAIIKQTYFHKVEVFVSVSVSDLYSDASEKAIEGCFVLAFIDEENNLIKHSASDIEDLVKKY